MRCLQQSALILVVALALVAAGAIPALAQEAQPTEQEAPAAEPSPAGPGLLNELGKLLKSPADLLPSLSKPESAPSPQVAQPLPPAAPPPASTRPPAPANATAAPPPAPAPAIAAPVRAEPPPAAEPAAPTRIFPGMATGREICPRSANGAPDCQAGADRLCQSKGYKGGKSLNMDSAFSCSSRQARAEDRRPCGTEHFVTSAFCN